MYMPRDVFLSPTQLASPWADKCIYHLAILLRIVDEISPPLLVFLAPLAAMTLARAGNHLAGPLRRKHLIEIVIDFGSQILFKGVTLTPDLAARLLQPVVALRLLRKFQQAALDFLLDPPVECREQFAVAGAACTMFSPNIFTPDMAIFPDGKPVAVALFVANLNRAVTPQLDDHRLRSSSTFTSDFNEIDSISARSIASVRFEIPPDTTTLPLTVEGMCCAALQECSVIQAAAPPDVLEMVNKGFPRATDVLYDRTGIIPPILGDRYFLRPTHYPQRWLADPLSSSYPSSGVRSAPLLVRTRISADIIPQAATWANSCPCRGTITLDNLFDKSTIPFDLDHFDHSVASFEDHVPRTRPTLVDRAFGTCGDTCSVPGHVQRDFYTLDSMHPDMYEIDSESWNNRRARNEDHDLKRGLLLHPPRQPSAPSRQAASSASSSSGGSLPLLPTLVSVELPEASSQAAQPAAVPRAHPPALVLSNRYSLLSDEPSSVEIDTTTPDFSTSSPVVHITPEPDDTSGSRKIISHSRRARAKPRVDDDPTRLTDSLCVTPTQDHDEDADMGHDGAAGAATESL